MRDAGVRELALEEMRVVLAPPDPPRAPELAAQKPEPPPTDPLSDPDLYGGRVPGYKLE